MTQDMVSWWMLHGCLKNKCILLLVINWLNNYLHYPIAAWVPIDPLQHWIMLETSFLLIHWVKIGISMVSNFHLSHKIKYVFMRISYMNFLLSEMPYYQYSCVDLNFSDLHSGVCPSGFWPDGYECKKSKSLPSLALNNIQCDTILLCCINFWDHMFQVA